MRFAVVDTLLYRQSKKVFENYDANMPESHALLSKKEIRTLVEVRSALKKMDEAKRAKTNAEASEDLF